MYLRQRGGGGTCAGDAAERASGGARKGTRDEGATGPAAGRRLGEGKGQAVRRLRRHAARAAAGWGELTLHGHVAVGWQDAVGGPQATVAAAVAAAVISVAAMATATVAAMATKIPWVPVVVVGLLEVHLPPRGVLRAR